MTNSWFGVRRRPVQRRLLQVIFAVKRPDEVEFESLSIEQWADLDENDRIIYVVHAMDLTPKMKRLYRKRRRPQ